MHTLLLLAAILGGRATPAPTPTPFGYDIVIQPKGNTTPIFRLFTQMLAERIYTINHEPPQYWGAWIITIIGPEDMFLVILDNGQGARIVLQVEFNNRTLIGCAVQATFDEMKRQLHRVAGKPPGTRIIETVIVATECVGPALDASSSPSRASPR